MIGHLRGSYDGDFPSGSYGVEHLEIVGSKGRIVIENACEVLKYFPRRSRAVETYNCLGGMLHFNETFKSRISEWVQDNLNDVAPENVNGSGRDGLQVQTIIEAAIKSWETQSIITLE